MHMVPWLRHRSIAAAATCNSLPCQIVPAMVDDPASTNEPGRWAWRPLRDDAQHSMETTVSDRVSFHRWAIMRIGQPLILDILSGVPQTWG